MPCVVPPRVALVEFEVKFSPATEVNVVAGSAAVVSVKVGEVQEPVTVAVVLAEVLTTATISAMAVR